MPQQYLHVVCQLFDTSHHYGYSLNHSSNVTDLETPNITESFFECHLWLGRLILLLQLPDNSLASIE